MKGTIKYINDTNGYGFITPVDQDKNIFFHYKDIVDSVKERDYVEFDVESRKEGLLASNVKLCK